MQTAPFHLMLSLPWNIRNIFHHPRFQHLRVKYSNLFRYVFFFVLSKFDGEWNFFIFFPPNSNSDVRIFCRPSPFSVLCRGGFCIPFFVYLLHISRLQTKYPRGCRLKREREQERKMECLAQIYQIMPIRQTHKMYFTSELNAFWYFHKFQTPKNLFIS